MDWYKRFNDTTSDPKFRLIAKRVDAHICFVLAVWDAVCEYVNKQENRGSVEGFNFELTAIILDLDPAMVERIFDEMGSNGISLHDKKTVTKFVTLNGEKVTTYNNAKSNAQRQKEFRERTKKQQEFITHSNDVTDSNARAHVREEKRREEKKESNSVDKSTSFCLESEIPEKKKINFNFSTNAFENITEAERQLWQTAYPAIILDEQLGKAAAWLKANPGNRKSNYEKFLNTWLSKSQDRAPRLYGTGPGMLSFTEQAKIKHDEASQKARERYAD